MLLHQKMIVLSVAAVTGMMMASAGGAQTAPQTPPPGAPAVRSPAQATPPSGAAAARLGLSQAQRDQLRTLRETDRKETQALREKMRTARLALRDTMRADVPDEAAVRSAAGAVAALEADLVALRARAKGQFMKVLTPEQQAQTKQLRARAAQRARREMRAERQTMRRDQMRRQRYYRGWRGWI
jgi:Spy/CpxP family protein refolding chaperone